MELTELISRAELIANEVRPNSISPMRMGEILLGTLQYIKDKGIGGGGSIDPELLEGYMPLVRDFSDDFNNDFTR